MGHVPVLTCATYIHKIATMASNAEQLIEIISKHNSNEPEFNQAFEEVCRSLQPLFDQQPNYLNVLRLIAEPERCILFRVPWYDDAGNIHVNKGYRVQYSSAIGPYKGGLRFHPTVTLSVVKFLGFEQIFKNALTSLPMGGGKGGSDFDPKGKSDSEVMRFCQSFMTELQRHIGPDTDVPAGDIGVGGREIGYLFGQYKRLRNAFEGVLTGKGPSYGGSLIRPEATGYGAVYFAQNWFESKGKSLEGLKCTISGSGNVAQYCCEKLLDLGAIPLTLSDSSGYVIEAEGFTREQLAVVMKIKNEKRGRISDYCEHSSSAKFVSGQRPWDVACDVAFPCATQNEIDVVDAQKLVLNKCRIIVEGANMPTTNEAVDIVKQNGIVLCPAKAANAGGVAVSGLEMSQNSLRLSWTRAEVDEKLKCIMKHIFTECVDNAKKYVQNEDDLQTGANIAGFLKVADAVKAYGML